MIWFISNNFQARIIELEDKLAQQQILYYQAKLKQSGITEKVVKEASSKQEKEDNDDFGPNYQGILDFFNEGFWEEKKKTQNVSANLLLLLFFYSE